MKKLFIRPSGREGRAGSLLCAMSYRVALPVTRWVRYAAHGYCYALCPRCGQAMEREYVRFCDRCGQKLRWSHTDEPQQNKKQGHE